MMDVNLIKILENTLLTVPEYISEDGKVLKAKVYEDAMMTSPNLIEILMNNESLKNVFFTKIRNVEVFDKQKIIWILENKEFLPDSYTRYRNKIGLVDNKDNFISLTNDVVLSFPYKDTVLVGGQDKEEQKRDEIFFNELIGSEQITRMLSPKVFTNAKRYSEKGVEENVEFNQDDNIIIKGNNLIALSCLLSRYEGQVKCIYVDPPYNTENDSFKYNDRFSRSTWLTFMKNRLVLAKQLLRKDGSIFVQCDDHEQAYLKVLMDEIFGEKNFVNCIAVKMSEPSGSKMSHVDKRFLKLKEYILFYKMPLAKSFNPIKIPKDSWDDEYNKFLKNFSRKDKKTIDNIAYKASENEVISEEDINMVDLILSKVETISTKKAYELFNEQNITYEEWLKANSYRIYRTAASTSVKKLADQKRVHHKSTYFSVKSSREGFLYLVKGDYSETSKSPRLQILFAEDYLEIYVGDFWSDISTTGLEAEGGVELKNGKKPEKILERVIEFSTNEGDTVLDFFMGSGTTPAVAHKMKRHYIGIEQMGYIEENAVVRLNRVIDGEQAGVSEEVKWSKGGSFVYCELMENANILIDEVQNSDESNIDNIKSKIYKDNRIIPYITRKEILELDKEFNDMNIEEKKKALISLVDKNKLYVNYSDMEDETYMVTEEDKKFTDSFYKKEV